MKTQQPRELINESISGFVEWFNSSSEEPYVITESHINNYLSTLPEQPYSMDMDCQPPA